MCTASVYFSILPGKISRFATTKKVVTALAICNKSLQFFQSKNYPQPLGTRGRVMQRFISQLHANCLCYIFANHT